MKLVHLFRLMRWQNLLILIIIQLLFKFVLFKNYQIATSLTTFDFILLVMSIIFIAAGGNVINDFFDKFNFSQSSIEFSKRIARLFHGFE